MAPKTPSQTTTTQEIPPAFKPAFLSLFNSAFGAARQQAQPFNQQQGFPIFDQSPAQSFFGGSGGQGGFASQLGQGFGGGPQGLQGFQGAPPGGFQGSPQGQQQRGGQSFTPFQGPQQQAPQQQAPQRGSVNFAQQAGGTPSFDFGARGGNPFQGFQGGGFQESFAGGQARPTGFPAPAGGGQGFGGAPQNFAGQQSQFDATGAGPPQPQQPLGGQAAGGKDGGGFAGQDSLGGFFGQPTGPFGPTPTSEFATQGSSQIPLSGGDPIIGQPFQGPFTSASSPLEFESLANRELVGRQLGGAGNSLFNLGQQTARGDFLDPNTNPALQGAIGHALQPAVDQFGRSVLPAFESQALGSGAFKGSSARDFATTQLANDFGRNILGTAGTIGAENFFRERGLQQNAGQLIDQAARLNQLSPEILAQVGEGQRALGQRGLDENLLRFQESQLAPFRPLLPLASIIQGGDIGSAGTATNFAAQPGGVASGIAAALGGGGVGAGVGDTFGQGGAGAGIGSLLGLLAGLA